tara:strand:- start:67 stop:345 length:279 start_codon:yes stop_codon:yes gene_type:complete
MASNKRAKAVCDVCGFVYPHRVMKKNSYGLLVCPTDYDGSYDLKNHPQNKTPDVSDDESISDPRPPLNNDRNITWEDAINFWENFGLDWNIA